MLIGITDKCQPQAGFLQTGSNFLGKSSSIIFRTECLKTTSIEYKTKRSAFNFVLKKINGHELAFDVGFRSFSFLPSPKQCPKNQSQ
jgi:hypothetical protein